MSRVKIFFLVVALSTIAVQLFIPISMATRYENILQTGERHLFKVVPRDPADPFKGRYVVLTFPISSGEITGLANPSVIKELPRKAAAYAIIETGADGFAQIKDVQKEPPQNQNYIKIKNSYRSNDNYNIDFPFDRYYAEESKAPEIESLLWNRAADQSVEFYAELRIKDGYGVIAELYVEDTPILEYLKLPASESD